MWTISRNISSFFLDDIDYKGKSTLSWRSPIIDSKMNEMVFYLLQENPALLELTKSKQERFPIAANTICTSLEIFCIQDNSIQMVTKVQQFLSCIKLAFQDFEKNGLNIEFLSLLPSTYIRSVEAIIMGGAASLNLTEFLQSDASTIAERLRSIDEKFQQYSSIFTDNNLSGSRFTNLVSKSDIESFLVQMGITNLFDAGVVSHCIMVWRDPSLLISYNSSNNSTKGVDKFSMTIPFPKTGVRLSVIREFIMDCGGESELIGLSITDTYTRFLKPLTYADGVSYCDYYRHYGSDSRNVSDANVFISQAWKYNFLEVVTTLELHFQNTPDIYIWFDLFSNNQHADPSLDFHWWSTTFKSAIAQFGYTVMVLSPWQDPIPLTRAWCLFELYCTAVTRSRFEIAISPTEKSLFLSSMAEEGQSALNRMLGNIDCRRSECWKEEDKKRIFSVVESVGFDKVNSKVFALMRDWVVATAETSVLEAGERLATQQMGSDVNGSCAGIRASISGLVGLEKGFGVILEVVLKLHLEAVLEWLERGLVEAWTGLEDGRAS
eukprot:gene3648-7275_t